MSLISVGEGDENAFSIESDDNDRLELLQIATTMTL